MAVSVIRKLTERDSERLEAAAQRFMARHFADHASAPVEYGVRDVRSVVELLLVQRHGEDDSERAERVYLSRLWLAAQRRAVGEPSATSFGAYGVIGIAVE